LAAIYRVRTLLTIPTFSGQFRIERDPKVTCESFTTRRYVVESAAMDSQERIATMRKLLDDLKRQLQAEERKISESMGRKELIRVLTKWREERGIGANSRYMRNRSTEQLRKMYDMVQAGCTYRVGRKIPSTKAAQMVTQK
jgi:hypothetical protein